MSLVKECCKKTENLEVVPSEKKDLSIMKCKICGCRHFELTLDPGKLGVKGTKI